MTVMIAQPSWQPLLTVTLQNGFLSASELLSHTNQSTACQSTMYHGVIVAWLPEAAIRARNLIEIQGPKAPVFGRFWEVLRPADRFSGPETGEASTRSPAKMHSPATQHPWWAAGRNRPRPVHQLVEISRRRLRALAAIPSQYSVAMVAAAACQWHGQCTSSAM
jgi:hypothetical protein